MYWRVWWSPGAIRWPVADPGCGSRTRRLPTSSKRPRLGFRRSATTLYPSFTEPLLPRPEPGRLLNLCWCLFRYMNDNVRNHNDQRPKRKTWTREDNQLGLHWYFRSNHSQRGYRKRMIEIWRESASFQTTSQKLADQVRTIIRKGWFYEFYIPEIHRETNKQDNNTELNSSRDIKKNNLTTSENENDALTNIVQPSNSKETL